MSAIMLGGQTCQTIRNNSKSLTRYIVCANIIILLYIVLNNFVILDQTKVIVVDSFGKQKIGEKSKFENFDLNKWNESLKFQLQDSEENFFT